MTTEYLKKQNKRYETIVVLKFDFKNPTNFSNIWR
jgi:hypothetical protein